MAARVAVELEELLDRMEKGSVPSDSSSRSEVIGRVAKLFGVKEDEVAIMELAPSGRTLRFVMPEKLRQVGSIPLSSNTALAARTARERRSDIINNFSAARHASVFEGVPLGRNPDEAIQKIMSAPILRGGRRHWSRANLPQGRIPHERRPGLQLPGTQRTERDQSSAQPISGAVPRRPGGGLTGGEKSELAAELAILSRFTRLRGGREFRLERRFVTNGLKLLTLLDLLATFRLRIFFARGSY